MNREQANELLDEHKNGIRIHPVVEVTKALWLTGDLRGVRRSHETSNVVSLYESHERTCVVQSEEA